MKEDIEPDIVPDAVGSKIEDRGESVTLMEPLMVAEGAAQRAELTDLAIDLAARSAGFCRSLPPGVTTALADLVRAMNCYYSNLIEGHDTHPVDIERALKDDYSKEAGKRNLQLEARAHITVQKWIDDGGLDGRAVTRDGLREIHRRFGDLLPDELLTVTNPDTGEAIQMVPGDLRHRDVMVGRHIAISPGAISRFLDRFEQAYGKGGKTAAILAAAAAHHRVLWIHPWREVLQPPAANAKGDIGDEPAKPEKAGKRVRYRCPTCDLKAWAKHDAQLMCGADMLPMAPE